MGGYRDKIAAGSLLICRCFHNICNLLLEFTDVDLNVGQLLFKEKFREVTPQVDGMINFVGSDDRWCLIRLINRFVVGVLTNRAISSIQISEHRISGS